MHDNGDANGGATVDTNNGGDNGGEELELRDVDRGAFLARLERNGREAVEQWHRAEQTRRR